MPGRRRATRLRPRVCPSGVRQPRRCPRPEWVRLARPPPQPAAIEGALSTPSARRGCEDRDAGVLGRAASCRSTRSAGRAARRAARRRSAQRRRVVPVSARERRAVAGGRKCRARNSFRTGSPDSRAALRSCAVRRADRDQATNDNCNKPFHKLAIGKRAANRRRKPARRIRSPWRQRRTRRRAPTRRPSGRASSTRRHPSVRVSCSRRSRGSKTNRSTHPTTSTSTTTATSVTRGSIRSRAASILDVPRQALDDAAVRRLRYGRGDERALPLPARSRADRTVDGVRHADADGLRLRPRALARRGRTRRRGGRLARRHENTLRRHPARTGCRRR